MGGIGKAVGGILGGGGESGGGGMAAPPPLNYGQEAGQYLFGMDYKNTGGFADPRFQQDVLASERQFQPQYAGLDLENIGNWMYGLEAGRVNPAIATMNEELTDLQDELAVMRKKWPNNRSKFDRKSKDVREKITALEGRLADAPGTLGRTPGLFDMQRAAAQEAGITQRSEQGLQQAADVGALDQYGRQITDAYRAADPYSAGLADQATALAQQDTGLGAKGREMLGAEVAGASAGEQALASSGLSRLNAQREGASAAEQSLGASGQANVNAQKAAASAAERALGASGLDNVNAQREAASAAEQELNKVGMSLTDLDPTAQEAILSGRGMEFAASTGELSPLEKRRATQSAREASTARGRGMDQGALYGEMESRMAEELNKQEREIMMGSSLLGQEAQMRNSRLGLGANILSSAEGMDQQRRQDQLQRQQFGSTQLGMAESMDAQRRQDQLQREQLGSSQLGQAESMDAQRRLEQFQQQQFGASNLGQSEAMAAQRRLELLQQQQTGAGFIGQDAGIQSQRLGQAYGMQRGMAGDIGSMLFGRPSTSQAYGGQMLGAGMQQAGGPQGPSLFDPNTGINLALSQRGQDIDFMGAQAAMQGAQAQGQGSMMGGLFGGIGSVVGGLFS